MKSFVVALLLAVSSSSGADMEHPRRRFHHQGHHRHNGAQALLSSRSAAAEMPVADPIVVDFGDTEGAVQSLAVQGAKGKVTPGTTLSFKDSEFGDIEGVVQSLAVQGAKGKVTPEMDNFVKQIEKMITDDMKPKIISGHESAQTLLDNFGSAFDECGNHKATNDVIINKLKGDRKTVSDNHKKCRFEEATAWAPHAACQDVLKSYKDAMDTLCSNPVLSTSPSESVCTVPGGTTQEGWLQGKADFFTIKHDEYQKAKKLCADAKEKYDIKAPECLQLETTYVNKHNECDPIQDSLEAAACSQGEKCTSNCATYTTCYDNAHGSYSTAEVGIRAGEQDRKGEWRGLMRIQCLLGVFAGSDGSGVSVDQIDTCKAKTHDTSHLDLAYPTVPGAQACIIRGTEPCLDPYINAEYGTLPGDAPHKTCTACSWNIH